MSPGLPTRYSRVNDVVYGAPTILLHHSSENIEVLFSLVDLLVLCALVDLQVLSAPVDLQVLFAFVDLQVSLSLRFYRLSLESRRDVQKSRVFPKFRDFSDWRGRPRGFLKFRSQKMWGLSGIRGVYPRAGKVKH